MGVIYVRQEDWIGSVFLADTLIGTNSNLGTDFHKVTCGGCFNTGAINYWNHSDLNVTWEEKVSTVLLWYRSRSKSMQLTLLWTF